MRIYDSFTQELRDFVPLNPGHVSMYVCGPTVQSEPHIGHLRSALNYDIARRWFQVNNAQVTFIRNVTDIDDKVLDNAKKRGEQWWALAFRMETAFRIAYETIGILPPSYEPRATAHMGDMCELISTLIEKGHAYRVHEGSADVYFSVTSFAAYGELTRQKGEDVLAKADDVHEGKRSQHDFALWKSAKAHEPSSASWDSPWGRGRPGWHIECSAMAKHFLGESFDIHGGGMDLRFPHHENERAQSTAAGHGFAQLWMHNSLVTISGQKMSKSLGNSVFASDVIERWSGRELRYFLASAHYRSPLDFSPKTVDESAKALKRIDVFLEKASVVTAQHRADVPETGTLFETLPEEFVTAMDNDFAVPEALACLHETVRKGNIALATHDVAGVRFESERVSAMMEALGFAHFGAPGVSDASARFAIDTLVSSLLERRDEARKNKNFSEADLVRSTLDMAGIVVEDSVDGTQWRVGS